MDRYTKGFVVASVVYFALAAGLGLWMGTGDAPAWAAFAHVHFNLLGFMAMMVYGVGYFVLPRFNARELRWPGWVPLHFWVANVGLVGMVAAYPGVPSTAFGIFAGLSVLSAVLFAVNIAATLLVPEREEAEQPARGPAAHQGAGSESGPVDIGPDTRVGEILARWPHTAQVFVEAGFGGLADPDHREQVKQLPITVRMACQRHGVDVDDLLARLRDAVARGRPRVPEIRPDQIIGEVLASHPETEAVFRKYYGSGCFSCPGQKTETIKQSAMIHNVDLDRLLEDLNRAVAPDRHAA